MRSRMEERGQTYRDLEWPAAKSVALLRNQYGGQFIPRVDEDNPRR